MEPNVALAAACLLVAAVDATAAWVLLPRLAPDSRKIAGPVLLFGALGMIVLAISFWTGQL
jgi:hypothetical protein